MPSGNSFAQLVGEWGAAAINGSMLKGKHDINGPARSEPIRSVISHKLSASLETFLSSGKYTIEEYLNNKHGNYYFVIMPDSSFGFSVAGYDVISGSQATGSALNRIVMVSGSKQGWHVFAEDSNEIATKESTGELVFQGSIK